MDAIGLQGVTLHDDSGKNAKRATKRDMQEGVRERLRQGKYCFENTETDGGGTNTHNVSKPKYI